MNFLVSFPRSGQNLTHYLLESLHERLGLAYSYCDFYCCCNKIPCRDSAWLQKNHDFGLSLQLQPTARIVTMYRSDPIDQLEAYFRFQNAKGLKNGHLHSPLEYDDHLFSKLVEFVRGNLRYYHRFVAKWTERADLVLEFDDYVSNPVDSLLAMMRVFRPEAVVPRRAVQATIDSYPDAIKRKSRLSAEFVAELAEALERQAA